MIVHTAIVLENDKTSSRFYLTVHEFQKSCNTTPREILLHQDTCIVTQSDLIQANSTYNSTTIRRMSRLQEQ